MQIPALKMKSGYEIPALGLDANKINALNINKRIVNPSFSEFD